MPIRITRDYGTLIMVQQKMGGGGGGGGGVIRTVCGCPSMSLHLVINFFDVLS